MEAFMGGDVIIRTLRSHDEILAIEELQRLVWPSSETDIVPAHLCLTIAHNGGLVLGAFESDELVGFLLGFLATDGESPPELAMTSLKHCSHQMGVHPDHRNKSIGLRLKIAQREFVLGQGIRLVTWTYDPLLSVNAHLNIRRLGAVCQTYVRDTYGTMRDALNIGVASDRFQVDWWVTSHRVKVRIAQSREPLKLSDYMSAEIQTLNTVISSSSGFLEPGESINHPESSLAMVEIPSNFHQIRSNDLSLATHWREHTRQVFEMAFKAGYIVTDFVFEKEKEEPRSFYVLSYGEATLG
jgi:predicted GNAT superfamily acetyltransferase